MVKNVDFGSNLIVDFGKTTTFVVVRDYFTSKSEQPVKKSPKKSPVFSSSNFLTPL